jgi:hypothetical protein
MRASIYYRRWNSITSYVGRFKTFNSFTNFDGRNKIYGEVRSDRITVGRNYIKMDLKLLVKTSVIFLESVTI